MIEQFLKQRVQINDVSFSNRQLIQLCLKLCPSLCYQLQSTEANQVMIVLYNDAISLLPTQFNTQNHWVQLDLYDAGIITDAPALNSIMQVQEGRSTQLTLSTGYMIDNFDLNCACDFDGYLYPIEIGGELCEMHLLPFSALQEEIKGFDI